jgi:hypothetical protein
MRLRLSAASLQIRILYRDNLTIDGDGSLKIKITKLGQSLDIMMERRSRHIQGMYTKRVMRSIDQDIGLVAIESEQSDRPSRATVRTLRSTLSTALGACFLTA